VAFLFLSLFLSAFRTYIWGGGGSMCTEIQTLVYRTNQTAARTMISTYTHVYPQEHTPPRASSLCSWALPSAANAQEPKPTED